MWYLDSKEKISILFNYDKNIDIPTLDIDYEFVYRNGTIKYKEMDNNTNILFENIETDTIYFMHLYDYYKLNGISSGKTYDSESFPSELPNYDLFLSPNGTIITAFPISDRSFRIYVYFPNIERRWFWFSQCPGFATSRTP